MEVEGWEHYSMITQRAEATNVVSDKILIDFNTKTVRTNKDIIQ